MQPINLDSPTYKSLYGKTKTLCKDLLESAGYYFWDDTLLLEASLYAAALFDPGLGLSEEETVISSYNIKKALIKWQSLGPARNIYANRVHRCHGILNDDWFLPSQLEEEDILFSGYDEKNEIIDDGINLLNEEIRFFQGIQNLIQEFGYQYTMVSLIQIQFERRFTPGDLEEQERDQQPYRGDPLYWRWSTIKATPAIALPQAVAKASLMTLDDKHSNTVKIQSSSGFSFPLLLESLSQGYVCDMSQMSSGTTAVILMFLAELTENPASHIQRDFDLIAPLQPPKQFHIFPPFSFFSRKPDAGYGVETESGYQAVEANALPSVSWVKDTLNKIKPDCRYSFYLHYSFLESTHPSVVNLRKELVEKQYLDLVIKLPDRVFGEFDGCIIVLDGNRPQCPTFIDASSCLKVEEENQEEAFDENQYHEILAGPEGPQKKRGIGPQYWGDEDYSLHVDFHLRPIEIPRRENTTLCRLGDLVDPICTPSEEAPKSGRILSSADLKGLDTLTTTSFMDVEARPDTDVVNGEESQSTSYLSFLIAKNLSSDDTNPPERVRKIDNDTIVVADSHSQRIRAAYYVQSSQHDDNIWITERMLALRPNKSMVNPEWILHALDATWARQHLERRAGRFKGLTMTHLLALPVLLPSLDDQNEQLDELKRERFGLLIRTLQLEEELEKTRDREKLYLSAKTHTIAQHVSGLKSDISTLRKIFRKNNALVASGCYIPDDSTTLEDLVEQIYHDALKLGETIKYLQIDKLTHPRRDFIFHTEVRSWIATQSQLDCRLTYIPPASITLDPSAEPELGLITSSSPEDLAIILKNLVENARRHGFAGAEKPEREIRIEVRYEHKMGEDSFAILRVSNNGKPLPNGFTLKHFCAPSIASGSTGNTGLGGWIIAELAKNAGAEISIIPPTQLADGFETGFQITFPIF
jgi:signal transduction histidine kinase